MSATDPHDIDARAWQQPPRYESTIPFYIGEWDCVLKPLGKSTEQQYRFVTIYGLTGTHDADDASIGGNHHNVVDRETMYQLDEYFAPWISIPRSRKKPRDGLNLPLAHRTRR